MRRLKQHWEPFLLCGEKSRSILHNNNGPNLPSDKSLLLANWVGRIDENNLDEKSLQLLSDQIQSSSSLNLGELSDKSYHSPRGSAIKRSLTPRRKGSAPNVNNK
jgi:hypothetical protein